MESEKVLSKIKKLLIQSESAREIGSEEEAMAFAEKAQRLMTKYNILSADLDAYSEEGTQVGMHKYHFSDTVTARRRILWTEQLAGAVTRAFSCRYMVMPGTNSIVIAGLPKNIEMAAYMLDVIAPFAKKQCQRSYASCYNAVKDLRITKQHYLSGFKESWYKGFSLKISERLRETQQSVVKEMRDEGTVSERALSVVDHHQEQVDSFVDELNLESCKELKSSPVDELNRRAAMEGYKAAESAPLGNEVGMSTKIGG